MSWNFASVTKFVRIHRRTDDTQNYKNVAQGQAAISNAAVNREKLKIAQIAADDKHELNRVKFARDSIKLEKEARDYWNSLPDDDRMRIAGQLFLENQAQLRDNRDKNSNQSDWERLNLKYQGLKYQAKRFSNKAWQIFLIALGITLGIPICLTIIIASYQAIMHMF